MNAMEKNRERDIPNNYIIDNKYIILEKIDEGGFAKIYLTKKIDTDEQYAIKVLKKGKTPNIEILSFLKEIEILTILTKSDKENKYIPHLYDSGKTNVNRAQNNKEVKLYYTTDYIQNKTLYEYVIVSKGFSERHTKYILSKILKGVKYCHDAGICHLDLHLKNILLDKNYEPKIIDFGLSLEMSKSDKLGYFKRETYTGKERCPEHFDKKSFEGKAVDIFYLGIMLLHLRAAIFGFDPDLKKNNQDYNYIKEKRYGIFWKYLREQYSVVSKLSPEFKSLYTSMVAYDPKERPSIDDILNGPWMKEINNLNEEEYEKLEQEVLELLSKIKYIINKKNETFEIKENANNKDIKGSINQNEGLKEVSKFDKLFFDTNLSPKYIHKKGINAKNYIIIKGKLDTTKFMNVLLNKIWNEYIEFCIITPYKDKLKANIKFEKRVEEDEDEEEHEEKEEHEVKEENEEKEEKEENEENEDNNKLKLKLLRTEDCNICIKLYEYIDGGYELHFVRRNGDIEDYYIYFDKIKQFIREILSNL